MYIQTKLCWFYNRRLSTLPKCKLSPLLPPTVRHKVCFVNFSTVMDSYVLLEGQSVCISGEGKEKKGRNGDSDNVLTKTPMDSDMSIHVTFF